MDEDELDADEENEEDAGRARRRGGSSASAPRSARQQAQAARMAAAAGARRQRHRAERADPYAAVHVGYLAELFHSPRFASLDASARWTVLSRALHHHERHLFAHDGAVAAEPPPYGPLRSRLATRRKPPLRGGAAGRALRASLPMA